MRTSSKISEDRSSWLSHGRRGWLGRFRLCRLCLAIRDAVVCIGRGALFRRSYPIIRFPMTKYLFEILFDWDGGHSLIIVFGSE